MQGRNNSFERKNAFEFKEPENLYWLKGQSIEVLGVGSDAMNNRCEKILPKTAFLFPDQLKVSITGRRAESEERKMSSEYAFLVSEPITCSLDLEGQE